MEELVVSKSGLVEDRPWPAGATAELAAPVILTFVVGTLLSQVVQAVLVGHATGPWPLVVGFAAGLAVCRRSPASPTASGAAGLGVRAGLLALLVTVGCVGLAALFRDYSLDGQQYHQQGVLALSQGWSPWSSRPYDGPHAIWVNGYPKAVWLWGAAWAGVLPTIECGKSLNLLLAVCGGLLAYAWLRSDLGAGRRVAGSLAALAGLNPVLSTQWLTYQNDSIIGSLLLISLVSLAMGVMRLRQGGAATSDGVLTPWVCHGLAVLLLLNIKLSGIGYAGLLLGIGAAAFALAGSWRGARQHAVVTMVGVAVGVLVVGWNPYVTNVLRHGHPLHPLAGAGKVDILTNNRPDGVDRYDPVSQLWLSVFSESHSQLRSGRDDAFRPKWPGVVHTRELKLFTAKTDMRIGGFGPWFSLGLLLAAGAFALACLQGLRGPPLALALLLPAAALTLTQLFPEPWWARYVPQFWLVPLALAGAALLAPQVGRASRALGGLALGVLGCNAVLVAALYGAGHTVRELDGRTQLESLAALSAAHGELAVDWGGEPALAQRLAAAGVRTRPAAANEPCAHPVVVHESSVRVCLPAQAANAHRDESAFVERITSVLKGAR